ncbi:MAG: ATP-binding protein [Thermoguttaceae bacterium]
MNGNIFTSHLRSLLQAITSRRILFTIIYLTGMFIAVSICCWNMYIGWTDVTKDVDKRLLDAVKELNYRVPKDYFDRAVTSGVIPVKEYQQYQQISKEVISRFRITEVYSLVEMKDRFYLTCTLTDEYFTEYDDTAWKDLRKTAADGITRYSSYTDVYGEVRSCICRFTTPSGQTYLMGADLSMENIRALRRAYWMSFFPQTPWLIQMTLVFLGLQIVLSFWMMSRKQWHLLIGTWVLFPVIISYGCSSIAHEEAIQEERWTQHLLNWVTIFAKETQNLGHAKIVPPLTESPSWEKEYKDIMALHSMWTAENDLIMYVYTCRLSGEKQVEFICSCPSDVDHDGVIEGKAEAGDPPFTVYDEADGSYGWVDVFDKAFDGLTAVDQVVVSPLYGASITCVAPLFDEDGKVEAVFGVDFDTQKWEETTQLLRDRSSYLLMYACLFYLMVTALVSSLIWLLQRSDETNEQLRFSITRAAESESATLAKSVFLANMSHEIRTPMNAILGYCTFLLRDKLPPKEREKALGIRTASQTLLSIINDILDFSKIEAGKIEIMQAAYDLASLVNETVGITNVRLVGKPIRFYVDIDHKLPAQLIGDEIRLRQVITNFLTNAVKFTSEGLVRLSMHGIHSNGKLLLYVSVHDTGMGIREEDMEKLFGSFQQLDTHKNRRIEGTGLGLAISRRFIELMGGTVFLETEYGKGSTFSFMVPQRIPEATPEFVSFPIPAETEVLLFGFSQDDTDSLTAMLDALGVPWKVVGNAAEFFEEVQQEEFTHYLVDESVYRSLASREFTGTGQPIVVHNQETQSWYPGHVVTLQRPFYVLPLAASLANQPMESEQVDDRYAYDSFTAPTAKVLVVDDNEINLQIASGFLSPYQLNIQFASSGREAIELLESNRYDVILMDHMMPEMDGVETTKLIRKMSGNENSQIPIIAATANALSDASKAYIEDGFNDYIAKPIEPAKLTRILKRWIPAEKQVLKAAPQLNTPLPDLELIDLSEGLLHAGEDMTCYTEVLQLFLTQSEVSLKMIDTLPVAETDWGPYGVEIRSIKDAAQGIGATPLYEASVLMERAVLQKDLSSLEERVDAYRELYLSTLKTLMEFLEQR